MSQEGGARDGKDIRVRVLWKEMSGQQSAGGPPAHPHGRAAVQVRPLRQGVPAAVAPGGARAAARGGQRVQVQSLQQGVPAEHGAETREDPQWPEAVRVQALLFGLIIDF